MQHNTQDYYGQLVTGTGLLLDPVYVRIESGNVSVFLL